MDFFAMMLRRRDSLTRSLEAGLQGLIIIVTGKSFSPCDERLFSPYVGNGLDRFPLFISP